MFKEFFITGLKLEYRPLNYQAGANFLAMGPVRCGSVMNTYVPYPMSTTRFVGALDYREYDSNKPFKRYYNVGKWARKMDLPFRATTGVIALDPNSQTAMQVDVRGAWAPGDDLGEILVTWYVVYRYRQRI